MIRSLFKQKVLWIAAFGYFVDLYDLVIYGVVRVSSLTEIGVPAEELFSVGTMLLNFQMAGMMIGGFTWGAIGDKKGRKTALFGSILIYSLATFANAFVHDVPSYALLRFIAGFGLAGELGAAVTLVSEVLPQNVRGLGSAFIATVGFAGAALSSLINQHLPWRNVYQIGGALGILLLLARLSVKESRIFLSSKIEKQSNVAWGSFLKIFSSSARLKVFFCGLMVGVPIWFVAGILSYFAPEFARSFHIQGEVTAGTTILVGYLGAMLGDVTCGLLSQWLQSRKKAVILLLSIGAAAVISSFFFLEGKSSFVFYCTQALIGFGNGYSALIVAWMAEAFGTNLRATVAITISNLIRASVIPLTLSVQFLKIDLGLAPAAMWVGVVCFSIAIFCAFQIPETFHRDLDYLER